MRLSKIRLAGFKSFVDPTTIHVPSHLVGIVGPNGCGKSNVIDAVRWVMGESSAKNLRGDSMADVIFNGSNTRKPVGHASVELLFDNSDGAAGGQYAGYSEISVKREVSRDGTSSYFLNGTRCRRRDITDLFLGTGLGPRSYSIIEQGTITRLVEAKPEELRVFLEEAAGVSKYKERRKETESRIQGTKENLSRLNDIRDEIDKQLQHLQRQVKSAEKYRQLKQDERRIKAELLALRWRVLDQETAQRERDIAERETELEAAVSRQRAHENALEQVHEQHIAASDEFNEVQGRYYGVGAEIARIEQAIHHAKETRQRQQQELERAEHAWSEALEHIRIDRDELERLDQALLEVQPAAQRARDAEQQSAAALEQAEEAMHDWQQEWDEFNRRAALPSETAQVERTHLVHLEQQLEQLRQRLARIEQEQRGLNTDTLSAEIAADAERERALRDQANELQQDLDGIVREIAGARARSADVNPRLEEARGRTQDMRGRLASLEALQQSALGQHEGTALTWLENQRLAGAPRLMQQLRVDGGWERAVETVLGDYLEAVCVPGIDAVAGALADAAPGALALFDTGSEVPAEARDGLPASLSSKVHAPWSVAGLTAGVYAAQTLREALAVRARLAPHESVITPEGIWLSRSGLRVARTTDENAGVLAREREIAALREQLAQASQAMEELQRQQEQAQQALQVLEQRREAAQARVNEALRRHAELRAEAGVRQARLEQTHARAADLQNEERELRDHVGRAEQEMRQARERLQQALGAMDTLVHERDALGAERDRLRQELERRREEAHAARDAMHALTLRSESLRTARATTEQSLQRMESQIVHLKARREALRAELEQGSDPLQALDAELAVLLNRRLQVEQALAQARQRLADVEETLRRLERERADVEQEAQDRRAGLEQMRLVRQEIKVRRQTLNEQVAEAGFQVQELLAGLPPDAGEQEWQRKEDDVAQKIQRLGPVNLAAIDEFAQQSERKSYLDRQHADLTEALATLEGAIHKIDRETQVRLQDTFGQINARLEVMFPRLFGGGHARLELTGDDLLEAGVTVMARPPGKRISTIHLLSGGEKALAAVALVFSIFELNPAPFCMLDEVDAPLDDTSVGRFCELVQTMSENVQFICITHNKNTMEMCRHLTGVTMHEPGVSRLVTVDVDEAVQLAAM